MPMGTRRQREKHEDLCIAHTELASAPGHPFYQKLNELLEAEGFDEFVESRCAKFYAVRFGRPSLTPGIYFRALSGRRELPRQVPQYFGSPAPPAYLGRRCQPSRRAGVPGEMQRCDLDSF